MKIAYISTSLLLSKSANSIHVMKMCQAFGILGHKITLLAPKHKKLNKLSDIYEHYGVQPLFEIKTIWYNHPLYHPLYGLAAALWTPKNKFDLVYGRSLYGCLCSALLKQKVVYEIHMPPSRITGSFLRVLIKRKNLLKVVVISNALKEHLIKTYKLPEKKIIVAHDGADQINTLERIILEPKDKFHVGYIGHLYPGKGMEIIKPLAKKCPWAQFHIIGGMDKDVAHWKDKLKLVQNVTFYGYIPHSQTDIYKNSFDVLIAPYQEKVSVYGGRGEISKWMSPLKIFEYMAAEKPIICSNLPVLKEILSEKTAILCDPDNISQWTLALIKLKNNAELRKSLAKNAKEDFKNKFTWKSRVKNILESV